MKTRKSKLAAFFLILTLIASGIYHVVNSSPSRKNNQFIQENNDDTKPQDNTLNETTQRRRVVEKARVHVDSLEEHVYFNAQIDQEGYTCALAFSIKNDGDLPVIPFDMHFQWLTHREQAQRAWDIIGKAYIVDFEKEKSVHEVLVIRDALAHRIILDTRHDYGTGMKPEFIHRITQTTLDRHVVLNPRTTYDVFICFSPMTHSPFQTPSAHSGLSYRMMATSLSVLDHSNDAPFMLASFPRGVITGPAMR